jgi:tubulin-specific chaperone A
MLSEKELKLKVGILKRSKKDLSFYEKEKAKQLQKIENMRADNQKFDEFDIRKQEEVLAETEAMLPESQNRLQAIQQEVALLLKQVPDGVEWASVKEANELLQG